MPVVPCEPPLVSFGELLRMKIMMVQHFESRISLCLALSISKGSEEINQKILSLLLLQRHTCCVLDAFISSAIFPPSLCPPSAWDRQHTAGTSHYLWCPCSVLPYPNFVLKHRQESVNMKLHKPDVHGLYIEILCWGWWGWWWWCHL